MTDTSWRQVDLEPVLSGTWEPPKPTVGRRTDGIGLFYPGKLHSVSSESEGGKTWMALAACAHEIRNGNHVVYVDFEDDQGGIVGRLLKMQIDPDQIRRLFHYHRPTEPLTGKNRTWDDLVVSLDLNPTLATVDGVTEAMTLQGLDPNGNKDIAEFSFILPKQLQAYGAAVVCLDHLTKSTEGRGRYALGGVHKLNGLDGAAYILENREPIGHDLKGRSYVRIAKDRPGQLRRHAENGKPMFWFADLVVDLTVDGPAEGVVTVEPPVAHDRPTDAMVAICDQLKTNPDGMSQTALEMALVFRSTTTRRALKHLIDDGYVTTKRPHKLINEFTVDDGQ